MVQSKFDLKGTVEINGGALSSTTVEALKFKPNEVRRL